MQSQFMEMHQRPVFTNANLQHQLILIYSMYLFMKRKLVSAIIIVSLTMICSVHAIIVVVFSFFL